MSDAIYVNNLIKEYNTGRVANEKKNSLKWLRHKY